MMMQAMHAIIVVSVAVCIVWRSLVGPPLFLVIVSDIVRFLGRSAGPMGVRHAAIHDCCSCGLEASRASGEPRSLLAS